MEVHEVVNHTALQVILYLVDDDLLTDINEFDVRQVFFIFINCLVYFFIIANPVSKILSRNFRILSLVVG